MTTLINSLRQAMYRREQEEPPASRRHLVLDNTGDPIMDSAAEYESISARMDAVSSVQQWIEDDDLEEGESSADRLLAMLVGVTDGNQDGELDDDEQEVLDVVREAAWDYLSALGVEDEDIDLLLNEWDEEAAERVRDLVAAALPDGEDEADAALDSFAFDDGDQEAVFDATYRKKVVVRNGKKKRVNKRVAGNVRLSAKQKLAIRKATMKSRSAKAKARRLKSMKVRKKMGL